MSKQVERAKQELIPDLKPGDVVAYCSGFRQIPGVFTGWSKTGLVQLRCIPFYSGRGAYLKSITRHHTERVIPIDQTRLSISAQQELKKIIDYLNPKTDATIN